MVEYTLRHLYELPSGDLTRELKICSMSQFSSQLFIFNSFKDG